jgi:hypothetical protein
MAGTAAISSSFIIEYVPSDTNATTISNPGRAFKVVAVSANNTTAGALTVTVTDSAPNNVTDGAQSIGANGYAFAELVTANLEISAEENLIVTASGTGLSPIHIHCVATGGGEGLGT